MSVSCFFTGTTKYDQPFLHTNIFMPVCVKSITNKPIHSRPQRSTNHVHAVWLISLINIIIILISNWLVNEPANQAWEQTDTNKLSTMQAYSWSFTPPGYCVKLFITLCCCVKTSDELPVSRWKVYFGIPHPALAITLGCKWSNDMTKHDSRRGRLKCQHQSVNPYG